LLVKSELLVVGCLEAAWKCGCGYFFKYFSCRNISK
jgi:hypothetical protein